MYVIIGGDSSSLLEVGLSFIGGDGFSLARFFFFAGGYYSLSAEIGLPILNRLSFFAVKGCSLVSGNGFFLLPTHIIYWTSFNKFCLEFFLHPTFAFYFLWL